MSASEGSRHQLRMAIGNMPRMSQDHAPGIHRARLILQIRTQDHALREARRLQIPETGAREAGAAVRRGPRDLKTARSRVKIVTK